MRIADVFSILEGPIVVEKVRCQKTGYAVEGPFETPALFQLRNDQFQLVESLIINGGNLKKVAEEVGVSYPTLRNRLDDIILIMKSESEKVKIKRMEILDAIERGEISADEGAKRLKEI
ncbi:MAG: DUF2089 domain-containing protein [Fibrobacteres bacterium]|nr:DUF2089 domain-containing protein [Fibrobacterota bacterium]